MNTRVEHHTSQTSFGFNLEDAGWGTPGLWTWRMAANSIAGAFTAQEFIDGTEQRALSCIISWGVCRCTCVLAHTLGSLFFYFLFFILLSSETSHFQWWCIKCLVCQRSLFCRTMGCVWRQPLAPLMYATHSLGLAVFVTGYYSSRRVWTDEAMFNSSTVIFITRDNIFILILWNLDECGRLGLGNVYGDVRLS